MNNDEQLNILDLTLTPKNANERGYRFVDDIPNLHRILNEIFVVASQNGYVLGVAKNENKVGLYQKCQKVT